MKIKLYRVILNILFYIFYVILVQVWFTFVFPTIQTILWYKTWLWYDVRFDIIWIAIIILVLLFTLLFRKYFYLPIREKIETKKEVKFKEYVKKEDLEEKKVAEIKDKDSIQELDIKVGKEIK